MAEQAADEVVGAGAAAALIQQAGEEVLRQQPDVFGEHGDDALEDEAAGADAVFASECQGVEGVCDIFRGFTRDLHPIVAEEGLGGAREKEVEGCVAGRQVAREQVIDRLVELGVEVVDPELIEVAEDDIGRAVGNEVQPVVESLLVVLGEFCAARLHFDEAAAGPDEIGEFGALAREVDAVFEGRAFRERVRVVAEGGEEVEEEGLGFALFVASQFGGELREVVQGLFKRGHRMRGGVCTAEAMMAEGGEKRKTKEIGRMLPVGRILDRQSISGSPPGVRRRRMLPCALLWKKCNSGFDRNKQSGSFMCR